MTGGVIHIGVSDRESLVTRQDRSDRESLFRGVTHAYDTGIVYNILRGFTEGCLLRSYSKTINVGLLQIVHDK